MSREGYVYTRIEVAHTPRPWEDSGYGLGAVTRIADEEGVIHDIGAAYISTAVEWPDCPWGPDDDEEVEVVGL